MTLTELRYVLALAKDKHFGHAANRCHVSQPTLSIAIDRLENELGVLLFERQPNQLRITEMGKKIVLQAQRVIDEADQLLQMADQGKSEFSDPLRIGAIYTVGPYLFPNLIPKLTKIAPQLRLEIYEDFTANLRSKLTQGELDVIIVSLPFTESNVIVKSIYEEPFVALMRKDHPLSKKAKIKSIDLSDDELLLLGEDHCFRAQVLNMYSAKKQASLVSFAGSSLETLRHMVAAGGGVTILPVSAAVTREYRDILVSKPIEGRAPLRRIALAWRMSFTRPTLINYIIKALSQSGINGICLLSSDR